MNIHMNHNIYVQYEIQSECLYNTDHKSYRNQHLCQHMGFCELLCFWSYKALRV